MRTAQIIGEFYTSMFIPFGHSIMQYESKESAHNKVWEYEMFDKRIQDTNNIKLFEVEAFIKI